MEGRMGFRYIGWWSLLLAVFLVPLTSVARPTAREISSAFAAGSAEQIAQWFSPKVDLTLLSEQSVYSSSQAKGRLSSFFGSHKPSSFKIAFTNARGERTFIIGNLTTGKGSYRVNIFLQGEGEAERITQLQICDPS